MVILDNESAVFQAVATAVRAEYPTAFIIGEEITATPPRFPTVTVIQNGNKINTQFSSFDNRENVVINEYKIEVYSNLQDQYSRVAQAKAIAEVICGSMDAAGYIRTFNQPVVNADATISRRVLRFRKNNLVMEVI